jgi:hypothetical protein
VSLADPPADGHHGRIGLERAGTGREPPGLYLAVAVDELHQLRLGCALQQPVEPRVAGPRRVKGRVMSSSTTSAPRARAASTDPSVEPESTYTTGATSDRTERRQAFSRSPSFRPITTRPSPGGVASAVG